MLSGFLHLVTSHPRYLNARYRRIGIFNHMSEWHWHWRRMTLLAVLLFGEAGGLYLSYLEGKWSAAAVASAVVLYVLLCMITKEMPLFTETGVRQRRKFISRLWKDIPLPCYCELRMRENMVFSGGIDTGSNNIDLVAKQMVAMYFLAAPPGVITYRYGYGEFLDDQIDMVFEERSEEYRGQMKKACEDYYSQLAYSLDGAPARYRRQYQHTEPSPPIKG